MHRWIFVAVAVLFASSVAHADLKSGLEAFKAGNYAAALSALKPLAESDNAEAQYRLGLMYDGGKGVEADAKTALGWFQKAAGRGHSEAKRVIGIYYEEGKAVRRSYERAVEWYADAASQGNAKAQRYLGGLYQDGLGVGADLKTAFELYTQAADGGSLKAKRNLAYLYYFGAGVRRDYKKAAAMFRETWAGSWAGHGGLRSRPALLSRPGSAQRLEDSRRAFPQSGVERAWRRAVLHGPHAYARPRSR